MASLVNKYTGAKSETEKTQEFYHKCFQKMPEVFSADPWLCDSGAVLGYLTYNILTIAIS